MGQIGNTAAQEPGRHSGPAGPGDGPVSPTAAAMVRWRPLRLGEVVLSDECELGRWQQRNSTRTLPHCIERLYSSGAMANLERVGAGAGGTEPHRGMHFSDSDVYKVLEAVAWDSRRGLPGGVEEFAGSAVGLISRAQRQDGYLNSWFQGQHPELAWHDLRWGHELYCAGHLLQAAVANRRADLAPELLDVANKLLAHLVATFSLDDGDGRLEGVCGHPEVETALVEFYRLTGDPLALRLAQRQVGLRGRADVALPTSGLLGDRRFPLSYFLHHAPVRERALATGHAVRELYLQAGVVDVAVEAYDEELLGASEAIWEDLFATKTYITGAHGSRHRDESIGDAYELPSDRAYAETCAAIASFQWNWRLLLATGRARYADAMERVFWNTIAGSVSRPGTEFFYSNTLHLRTGHDGTDEDSPRHRLPWYKCACCPPNLARLMASIQAYLVTKDSSGLQVHMPFTGTVSTTGPAGPVELAVRSDHPWGGTTDFKVTGCQPGQPWALWVRWPEWADREGAQVTLNGLPIHVPIEGSYIKVERQWATGDGLSVSTPVPIRAVRAHWRVDAVRGCAAVQRGPLVYCIEADDLAEGTALEDVALDLAEPLLPGGDVPAGLEGYVQVVVHASGRHCGGPGGPLYEDRLPGAAGSLGPAGTYGLAAAADAPGSEPLDLTLVPYFARGNRPSPAMRVWAPALGPGDQAAPPPSA